MADKGWTARIGTAAGVAAGTGAAQLGLGYGLGVVVWPVASTTDTSIWLGSLGWATWITASATVFGAVIAARLAGSSTPRGPLAAIYAISAGIGALVAVALIALPARDAVRLEAHSPQAIAGTYALIGVALGVIVAFWAVRSRPVGANLTATAAWLWALAITAIVVELSLHRDSETYLTSWQFAEATSGGRYGTIYWPSALLTISAAFLIGALAAAPAARRNDLGVAAATSGAAGPLLVAASFLVLSPRLTGELGPLESAYLMAPYAVLAGLAGSAVTIAATKSLATRANVATPDPDSAAHTDSAGYADSDRHAVSDRHAGEAASAEAEALGTAEAAGYRASDRRAAETATANETAIAAVPADPWAETAAGAAAAVPYQPAERKPDEPRPSGRAKLPAQAKPASPAPKSAPNPASKPAPSPAPKPATPKAPAADPKRGTPQPTPVAEAKSPRPVNEPPKPPAATPDPEIAAAARPARGRKATSPAKSTTTKVTKSTVTPPPQTPTVAKINPED